MIFKILIASILLHIGALSYKIPKPILTPPKPKPKVSIIKIKMLYESSKKLEPQVSSKDPFMEQLLGDLIDDLRKMNRDRDFVNEILKRCKRSYIGIGVSIGGPTLNTITHIGYNTPAENSGIQVGDIFAIPNMPLKNVYPKGTSIIVPLYRKGIIIHISVTVDKICSD